MLPDTIKKEKNQPKYQTYINLNRFNNGFLMSKIITAFAVKMQFYSYSKRVILYSVKRNVSRNFSKQK